MNFRLANTIYGKPWLINSQSALSYLLALEQGKSNEVRGDFFDNEEDEPKTIFQKLFANRTGIVTAPIHRADEREHPGYEGSTLAILPVIGPLMKEDFCGWYGTASLKNELGKINSSSTVKTVVMLIDSPGGSVDGTQALADAYRGSTKEKITVTDGMMCSAGYWIGSSGDKIVLSAQTDLVGCIGTMIGFYDWTKFYEEKGIVLREYTATDSKDKNKDFNEAKKGNGKLLIESTLDPMNDVFLAAVRSNRGTILDEKKTLTGKTFVGQEAIDVGLADEIDSIENVLNKILEQHSRTTNLKIAI